MAGYLKSGNNKLFFSASGALRLRESLAPPIVEAPVVGGFYVATTGNDASSGSSGNPFATLSRALTATRSGAEKRVFIRGGTYYLTSKISMNSLDKGTTITAYPNETVILSGGEKLTGFTDEGDGLYSKALAEPSSLDLSIGGVRQRVSQSGYYSPSNPFLSGWLVAQSAGMPNAFVYASGEISPSLLSQSTLAHVFDADREIDFITPVSGIDNATKIVTLLDAHPSGTIGNGATYRIMNHPSLIGHDGEFSWRVLDSKIIIRPSSNNFESLGVVLPKLDGLFDLQDGADDITFLNIGFCDAKYTGYAVSVSNSNRARFGGCSFKNVGDGIVSFAGGNGSVGGCSFSDLAGNGIVLNEMADSWKIYSNKFNGMGKIRKQSAAVVIQGADSATIAYNEIQFAPKYGVLFKGGSSHRVIYNIIKDTVNEATNGAAIEFDGNFNAEFSSLVQGNQIDRTPGYPGSITGEFSDEFNSDEFDISTTSLRSKSSSINLANSASGVTILENFTRGASVGHFVIDGGDRNDVKNNISILDEYDEHYAVLKQRDTA